MDAGVRLYLVRHAIAADRGPDHPDDSRRPLTSKGAARFRECAAGLVALAVRIDEILTSPYLRARQTAELLAEAFDERPPVTSFPALAVGRRPEEVVAALARHASRRDLALVGHEPGIGLLAARLLGQRRPIAFKKGAVGCVEVDTLPPARPGDLRWFAPPRLLRRLARP